MQEIINLVYLVLCKLKNYFYFSKTFCEVNSLSGYFVAALHSFFQLWWWSRVVVVVVVGGAWIPYKCSTVDQTLSFIFAPADQQKNEFWQNWNQLENIVGYNADLCRSMLNISTNNQVIM